MRMIAIHAQTERKRLDRSVRCAEKRRPWARKQRLRGLIRPDPAVCATAGAARGRKSLSSARIQATFTSNDTPLGECRFAMSLATSLAREEYYHSFSEFRGATDPGLTLPKALQQLSEDFEAEFYKDENGNIHVIRVAVDVINTTLGLIPIGIDEAARGIAVNQFMVSDAGELIAIGQSDDPARQMVVSGAALSGGVAAGAVGSTACGGARTLAGWACGVVASYQGAQAAGYAAGMAYDFGWE